VPKTFTPPKFDPKTYLKATLNDLVVYSIYYLNKQGSEITSDDVVSASFILFPKRFSLQKYPQWPDSAVVSRRFSDCKSKGFLTGSASDGFKLTNKGARHAEKLEKSFGKLKTLPAAKKTVHTELKSRAGRYVRSVESSEAYSRYKQRLEMNEFDFRSLLLCTMESPPETLSRNLEQFKEYANILEREEITKFLEYCGTKFAHMLPAAPRKAPARKRTTAKKRTTKKGR